ncbi:MAG: transketolase [Gammaproteobacteria bacterium]
MRTRRELANAIRALAMDAVERANSGHPGMPMGMADIAEVLWNDFLRHNPANPFWFNRDRFLLSNGHGCMLLYALLHLSGYDLSIEDLKQFRKLDSRTPGHPEYGVTPGVEATTGPLGQGIAMGVGMALAEKRLAAEFNQPDAIIVEHHTYVFAGDGCLMEGISHEAASLAGTLGLGRLIMFYDDNGISIDGNVDGWFRDDTSARFRAYGWHVCPTIDGHSAPAIRAAIEAARAVPDRPSLIPCRTIIGFGAPDKAGTAAAHGAALGAEEVAKARLALDWKEAPFVIPKDIYAAYDRRAQGARWEQEWQAGFEAYRLRYPDRAREFARRMDRHLPDGFEKLFPKLITAFKSEPKKIATRKASEKVLETLAPALPEILGGSADLTESNATLWGEARVFNRDHAAGNYVHWGVREFGMTAALNGVLLHGGLRPFGATFLIFSDYARNAIRLAALMKLPAILVLSHDSIALGEDGPTHQPIEQLASLRLIPGLRLWRPADGVETVHAWQAAFRSNEHPTLIVLTRQGLPPLSRTAQAESDIHRGGYILKEPDGTAQLILIATGSEVCLALEAAGELTQRGMGTRVVSMPSLEVFESQEAAYREAVLPHSISRRLVIEAGVSAPWFRIAGTEGDVLGIDRFGLSGPGEAVYRFLGFTVDAIVRRAEALWTDDRTHTV